MPITTSTCATSRTRSARWKGLNASWPNSGTWTSTGANGTISGANDSVGGGAGTFDNACGTKTVTALGEVMGTCPYPPKQNSYYVAGLAYYANTTDLRTDFPNDRGIQNVQTFMIDTQEFNNNPLDGPKNMLWLTGKYGGFNDKNGDTVPDAAEWDADGDGVPDNYVLATQPQNLVNGLDRAFDFIDSRLSSASSASVNSGSISDLTRIYQTRFNSGTWTGQLLAFAINDDGTLGDGSPPLTDAEAEWDAGQELPGWNSRQIITRDSTGAKVAFQWNSLDAPAPDAARQPGIASSICAVTAPTRATSPASSGRASSANWAISFRRRRCSSAGRRFATATISRIWQRCVLDLRRRA
jgi:type IV pilus assembly protein PilY1